MAFNATPGSPSANSYVTDTEAEIYFEDRGQTDWAEVENPEGALVTATQFLDWYISFKGTKTNADQALAWPRTGAYHKDGTAIAADEIPREVKQATFECALYFQRSSDPLAPSELAGLREAKAGSLTLKVDPNYGSGDRPRSPVPAFLYKILSGLYEAGSYTNQLVVVPNDS